MGPRGDQAACVCAHLVTEVRVQEGRGQRAVLSWRKPLTGRQLACRISIEWKDVSLAKRTEREGWAGLDTPVMKPQVTVGLRDTAPGSGVPRPRSPCSSPLSYQFLPPPPCPQRACRPGLPRPGTAGYPM